MIFTCSLVYNIFIPFNIYNSCSDMILIFLIYFVVFRLFSIFMVFNLFLHLYDLIVIDFALFYEVIYLVIIKKLLQSFEQVEIL